MSRITLLAVFSVALLTSACSSRLNPLNWFGRDRSEPVAAVQAPGGVVDARPFVTEIVSLRVDRAPGGAIVNTVGRTSTQGYWEPALLIENRGVPVDGVLTIQFRASGPYKRAAQGTERSREITAAVYLTDQEMAGVRTIVVRGASNQRSVRR